MSCGSRRRIESTIAIVPLGAHERVAGEVVVGVRTPERDVARRRVVEVAHHDRIVDESDRHVRRPLEVEQARLGRLVRGRRAMPVEVVGRQVEPERGVAAELLGPRQAEAAALDDVGVELHLERVDERNVGVAGGDRAQAGGGQHGRREQARRRLAVGPRDGEDRSSARLVGPAPTGRRARSRCARERRGAVRRRSRRASRAHPATATADRIGRRGRRSRPAWAVTRHRARRRDRAWRRRCGRR